MLFWNCGTMEKRSKVVKYIALTCVVQHTETHQGRLDRSPNPADDIAAIANEVQMYVYENHWNPFREESISQTY